MSRTQLKAIAEDMRKLGGGLMLAGIVGSALQSQVPALVAIVGGVVGIVLMGVGVWITSEEQT